MEIRHHDPAAEANAKLGGSATALVLEPSPPADHDGPFFADDPAAIPPGAANTVGPTSAADRTWTRVVADRPELSSWASERWLAAYRPLQPVPADYPETRNAYHRLAYAVVAEARRCANTKFGLRYTNGGFGTPFFGDDRQVRVRDGVLVVQHGAEVTHNAITSLRAAAQFVGVAPGTTAAEHDSPPLGDVDADLGATVATCRFLGDWFGFSWAVLEELRVTPCAVDAERVQLWPGHFDPCRGDRRRRAGADAPPTAALRATMRMTSRTCTSGPGATWTATNPTGTRPVSTEPHSHTRRWSESTTLWRPLSVSFERDSTASTGRPDERQTPESVEEC